MICHAGLNCAKVNLGKTSIKKSDRAAALEVNTAAEY